MKLRAWILAALPLAAGIGCGALRRWILTSCVDEAGLVPAGTPAVWVLTALSIAVLAALAVLCRGADRSPELPARSIPGGVLALAAGAALAVQQLRALPGAGRLEQAAAILGLAAAVVLALDGVLCLLGRRGWLLCDCVPALYLALQLISNYRSWSSDPAVLDYSFSLLFAICAMLTMYHMAAFQLGRGKRRLTLFWTLGGIFCGLVCLLGGRYEIGILLALCAGGWRLLAPEK